MKPRLLNLRFLIVGLAVAIFGFGAGGGITGSAGADEPAEPLSPYARSGFAEVMSSSEAVLVGFVNARGSPTTARFQIGKIKSLWPMVSTGSAGTYVRGAITRRKSNRRLTACIPHLPITSGSLRRVKAE